MTVTAISQFMDISVRVHFVMMNTVMFSACNANKYHVDVDLGFAEGHILHAEEEGTGRFCRFTIASVFYINTFLWSHGETCDMERKYCILALKDDVYIEDGKYSSLPRVMPEPD